MSPSADAVRASLDARIARARALAVAHPATAELLTFYAGLADVQRTLLEHLPRVLRGDVAASTPLAARIDTAIVATLVPDVLAWLGREGPPALRAAAATLAAEGPAVWRGRLDACLAAMGDASAEAATTFVCEVTLQPFAEAAARALADAGAVRAPASGPEATCPCCGALPVMGVLRERGHGAGRALVCGRCLTEWAAPRIVCPSCGGIDVAALPVFRAESWPAVRLDACETCRAYLKSIDLTVDGHAIAVVDDLATTPLDLWAAEQGFRKRRPNLLLL